MREQYTERKVYRMLGIAHTICKWDTMPMVIKRKLRCSLGIMPNIKSQTNEKLAAENILYHFPEFVVVDKRLNYCPRLLTNIIPHPRPDKIFTILGSTGC